MQVGDRLLVTDLTMCVPSQTVEGDTCYAEDAGELRDAVEVGREGGKEVDEGKAGAAGGTLRNVVRTGRGWSGAIVSK